MAINCIFDFRWDACNRKFCPYLKELTESEEKIIVEGLRTQRPEAAWVWSSEIPAHELDPVGLHCPADLAARSQIFDRRFRFPRARAFWTREVGRSEYQPFDFVGKPLVETKSIGVSGDRLVVRSLTAADEGVYRFGYEWEPRRFATVCFFVVYLAEKVKVSYLVVQQSYPLYEKSDPAQKADYLYILSVIDE